MRTHEPTPRDAAAEAARDTPHSPARRLAALVALLALLASAAVTSCWILTGQADFSAARRPPQAAAADEAAGS